MNKMDHFRQATALLLVLLVVATFLPKAEGVDGILRHLSTRNCVDVFQADTADGATVDIIACSGAQNQGWNYNVYKPQTLINVNSQKCLISSGSIVTQMDCHQGPNYTDPSQLNELWFQTYAATANNLYYYYWISVRDWTLLTASDANTAAMTGYTGADNQLWNLDSNLNLINKQTGTCLDVYGGNTANGATTNLYSCYSAAPNQHWLPGGQFNVVTYVADHSGKCLTAEGITNAAIVDQWTCTNPSPNQFWITDVEGITSSQNKWFYRIRSLSSNLCLTPGSNGLTVHDCSFGVPEQLFTDDSSSNAYGALFRIKPLFDGASQCLQLKSLGNDDFSITQKKKGGLLGTNEGWTNLPSTKCTGCMQLRNSFRQACLTIETNGTLDTTPCNENDNQLWTLDSVGALRNVANGNEQCLDVNGANPADNAIIGLYPCTPGAANEQFIFDVPKGGLNWV